jgi:superfamily II DNA or RNA helicase
MRKHQVDMDKIIKRIIAGEPIKDIICKVTTGGGKSTLPIIAGKLITAGLADAVCWICPRTSLQIQAEKNFIDPFFRKLLDHKLVIRASTNDNNPCRGTNGFVTTYQAVGLDKYMTVYNDFFRKRYILILDEYHHAEEEDGSWTQALMPLYEQAAYRVLMTGTLSRGDGKKIAFTPYCLGDSGVIPALEETEATAVIEYSRSDALAERAILPLEFIFAEGRAKWEKKSGRVMDVKLSTVRDQTARHALYTALHTEYAQELLELSVAHWKNHRRLKNRHSKLLVVAAGIKNAKQYTNILKSMGENAQIATSDDSTAAHKAIKAYKNDKIDILVSVNICYEGLDVPAISHICCLTNIRSREWIEQMAGRAVRVDPRGGPYETQKGYIFAPKDEMFTEIKEQIEAEQTPFLKVISNGSGEKSNGNKLVLERQEQGPPGGIVPLSSSLMSLQEQLLLNTPDQAPSEIEADLREQIEKHIRAFSFQNRYNPKKINGEVYSYFYKKRENMTIPELEACLSYIRSKYPMGFTRGTGRPRVPTKAVPINVQWKAA